MASMHQAAIAGSSDQSRIWLAKAPLTAQQDLSPLFRLGRTLRDIPTRGKTQQHPPLLPLPQAVIPAPPPAADARGLVGAMECVGVLVVGAQFSPPPASQDSDASIFCTPVPLTLPSLGRAAHHQWRCLHRLHISKVTRSVQCPAVVPLIECGIVVWSRRGDSQSCHLHGRLCPLSAYQGGKMPPFQSLSYLIRCCSSGSPPGRISCLQAWESSRSDTAPAATSSRGTTAYPS